jgi:hypothetical protein
MAWPDLVVVWGVRSTLSLIGLALIVFGGWRSTTVVEEKDVVDHNTYTNMADDGDDDEVKKMAAEINGQVEKGNSKEEVSEKGEEYSKMDDNSQDSVEKEKREAEAEAALVKQGTPNYVWIHLHFLGWIILCVSYIFSRHKPLGTLTWWSPSFPFAVASILCVIFLILTLHTTVGKLLEPVEDPAFRHHFRTHAVAHRKRYLQAAVAVASLLLIGLGLLTSFANPGAPQMLAPIGAFFMILAPFSLHYTFLLGGSSTSNIPVHEDEPSVFNFAGPCLAVGSFFFWLGLNLIAHQPSGFYLPWYISSRTWMAFIGAIAVIAAYWSISYAHDELSASYEPEARSSPCKAPSQFFLFLAQYRWFRFLLVAVAWGIFACTPFYPLGYDNEPGLFAALQFLAIVLFGLTVHQYHERIMVGDAESQFYMGPLVLAVAIVVVFLIGITSGMDIGGIVMVAFAVMYSGYWFLHRDRKRGKYWLETQQTHPDPVIYSYGSIIMPIGMMIFAWGLSIP